MSASPIFPIRWTPVPVTIPVSSSPSCSQTRPGPYTQPREQCKNPISTTWDKLKHLFARSCRSPVRRLELLAEAHSYSQGCICLSDPDCSKYTGTLCSGCHGSNVEEWASDIAMDIAPNTAVIEPKKSFERDWKEIRQRLERKIAAAAAQAISGRPGGAEVRKHRWATPPKQKEPRLYQVKQEDKLTTRGANPRTGVVSPSNRTDSSCEDHVPRPRVSQKWKVNGDQWISVDVAQTPSPQSSPLSYKLAKTVSSAGSGSTDISSSDDWEDRFVVHMPSAKEPNPPSMSVEQIRMYQEKMEKLHTSTVRRHEMDASKPSSGSPQHPSMARVKMTSSIPVAQRDPSLHSLTTGSSQSISPPGDGSKRYYFSPDEVGRAKVSPVNDNSKLSQKDLLKKLREECFLGCMGVDEAAAKNPDEILLFPNLEDDDIEFRASPVMKSEDNGDKSKPSGMPPSSKLPRLSGQPPAQASPKDIAKEYPTPRTTPLVIPPALTAARSTKIPKPTKDSPNDYLQHSVNEDNTRKSTPPIATTTKKPVLQVSRTRLAFKTSSRPRDFPSKSRQTTPEHDLFFESPSPSTTREAVHVGGQQTPEQPSKPISPDFDKTNLGQIPEDKAISTPKAGNDIRLSPSDIFRDIPGKGPQLHEILSPEKARARNDCNANQRTPKAASVAELDGLQVSQQLPSPPLSASPSPPPLKAKADISPIDTNPSQPEKRNTHAIRMEIRMKAEKARQGAAAAKSASERLAAARKHAERLAEARAAYDKAKAQSAAKKTREPLDELKQQKLNAERINEARKAYKAAKAKEAEEAKRQEEMREAAAKNQSRSSSTASPSASAPTSQHISTKPVRKPSRRSGAKRLSRTSTIKQHEDTSIPQDPSNKPHGVDLPDIASGPGSFYLTLISFHDSLGNNLVYSHALCFCEKLFDMATHCFKVCKRLAEAWLEYKQTGVLPQSCVDEFGDLAADIGQALVNFAILYYVFVVIVKIAGYIAVITDWILWFGRPVGLIFGHILDAVWE